MTQTLAKKSPGTPQEIPIEQALVMGDLSKLDSEQRVNYYLKVCSSLGLNPLTRPFDYLVLNGKLVLYARKDATDQLRHIHKVSITRLDRRWPARHEHRCRQRLGPEGRGIGQRHDEGRNKKQAESDPESVRPGHDRRIGGRLYPWCVLPGDSR